MIQKKNLSSLIGMTHFPSDPAQLVLADWSTLLKKFQLYLNNICQLRLMGVDKNKQQFNGFICISRNCKTFERWIKKPCHTVQCWKLKLEFINWLIWRPKWVQKRLFFGNEYIYVIYNFISTSDFVILHTVSNYRIKFLHQLSRLTLILLTWRIWWARNNASKWQMVFNSAFKGLITLYKNALFVFELYPLVVKYSNLKGLCD